MALTRTALMTALAGAGQLMRFDAHGVRQLDTGWQGARNSFWAAALTLPVFIFLNLVGQDDAHQVPAGTLQFIAVQAICYVLQWSVLPLALFYLCNLWRRLDYYPRLIASLNWLTVWQSAIYVVLGLLMASNALPLPLLNALTGAAAIYLIAVEAFSARKALNISGMGAVGVVLLDLLVTWQIASTRALLLAQ